MVACCWFPAELTSSWEADTEVPLLRLQVFRLPPRWIQPPWSQKPHRAEPLSTGATVPSTCTT
ncbi:unnamed protein product [Polarella glacialis]|uniref:Uncharacterized protein n=1 Tax=Polarella glacialis TaxID=89957 RepID=A0A813K9K4_POLGL|nr:unnamed protein product [Polarella glacialis]